MGSLLAVCRPRKRIAPARAPSTADTSTRSEQEAAPSRAVRSCTTGLQAQVQMPTQQARRVGQAVTPVDSHSFYKSLRQEEAALDLDRLHVLKIRNREAEGRSMTKDKFSKYSPLPDISRPHGRPLLRQKTYDVLEPVYVKGPPTPKPAAASKERPPPPRTAERGRTTPSSIVSSSVVSRTMKRDGYSVASRMTAPRTKLPHIAAPVRSAVVSSSTPTAASSNPVPAKRTPLRRTTQQFRPQELSKDILPQSPTAFWFPI